MAFSATDLAIRIAKRDGHLCVVLATGRFGEYAQIRDQHGTIEVADNQQAADRRIEEACGE